VLAAPRWHWHGLASTGAPPGVDTLHAMGTLCSLSTPTAWGPPWHRDPHAMGTLCSLSTPTARGPPWHGDTHSYRDPHTTGTLCPLSTPMARGPPWHRDPHSYGDPHSTGTPAAQGPLRHRHSVLPQHPHSYVHPHATGTPCCRGCHSPGELPPHAGAPWEVMSRGQVWVPGTGPRGASPTCVTMERSMRQQTMQQTAAVSSRRSEPAPGWGNRSRMPVMKPSTPTNCVGRERGSAGMCHPVPSPSLSPSPHPPPHLAVQPQHEEHEEEERGPERGQGHQRHGFGVGDESQPGACRRGGSAVPPRGGTQGTPHCPALTGLGHLGDVHALLGGHEAQHGEDDEAGEEAGGAVDDGQDVGVPAGRAGQGGPRETPGDPPAAGKALPVAVVVEAVVAAQRGQGAQPDGVGEEDLGAGIDPDLGAREGVRGGERARGVPSAHPRFTLLAALTCASASLDQSGFR